MATITRFDFGLFDPCGAAARQAEPRQLQRFFIGMEEPRKAPQGVRHAVQVTPLDERLQPCGAAFVGEVEGRTSDTMALWHSRPVRARYLAIDLPLDEGRQERVILRVTYCESFGLDYSIRGDLMGS